MMRNRMPGNGFSLCRVYRAGLFLAFGLGAALAAAQPKVAVPPGPFHPYGLVDLTATGLPEVAKPNDPAAITLDAEITPPSGPAVRIPGFAMHAMKEQAAGRRFSFVPSGPWEWHLRYAPPAAGEYRGVAVVTTPQGTSRSAPFRFTVTPDAKPARGMIRVAQGNPRALAYDDGSNYIPLGQDLCFAAEGGDPRVTYKRWLDRLAGNGANFIRVWLSHAACFGLEGPQPYAYNESGAFMADEVLRMCEQRGIAILMCVEHVRWVGGTMRASWEWRPDYPYDKRNGGPAANSQDMMRLPAARVQYQALLRYLIARYGYSSSVFAWEFWNEMDSFRAPRPAIVEWTGVMADWMHAHDPYRHLVTNSLGSNVVWPELWKLPGIDVIQYHDYGGRDFYKGKSQVEIFAPAAPPLEAYGKPVVFSEVGLVDNNWGVNEHINPNRYPDVAKDTKGYAFHEALWAPFFAGACSSGMHWWWPELDHFTLYGQYKPLAELMAAIPLASAPLPRVSARASTGSLTCLARGNAWGTVAWVFNAHDPWQALVIDKKQPERVSGAVLTLPQAGAGEFAVQCIDPWTGKELLKKTIQSSGDTLTVPLPDFTIDVAVKAVRAK